MRSPPAPAWSSCTAFRDAVLLHLSVLPTPISSDALVSKLVQAGSTLEYLKYYEQFFELFFVGGLLQPGGSYVDDVRSPVYIIKDDVASAIASPDPPPSDAASCFEGGVKGMVDVLKRVIQRFKYLQKPLEENFLPDLLGYLAKYHAQSRAKLAEATALLILDLQISPRCLQSLVKDHVVKDGVALDFLTSFIKVYVSRSGLEGVASTLRRSGLPDISLVFPQNQRARPAMETHWKNEGLSQVNDWQAKKVTGAVKDETIAAVARMIQEGDSNDLVCHTLTFRNAPTLTDRSSTTSRLSKLIERSPRPN